MDPLVSLAFGMHATPGAYALLLGSGISRAASVPTGWEVVLDLVNKVAALKGEAVGADATDWYQGRFGEEPDYAVLLERLARTPAERQRLLRSYFEPTEDEREQGLKVPTAAHRAIARLVSSGHIRVIVTTNFDRLLEQALSEVGVVATVIATPDMAEGALPLVHTDCTIVKVHGDYVDSRLRNTPTELASYDLRIDHLLDRIFDEYGLVVCGWSAEWDAALRDAVSRCKAHRFSTYWAARSEPTAAAQTLVTLRRATLVPIESADTFFTQLEDKVAALAELEAPHPLTTRTAVATLKRYLPEPRYQIRLHDLVHGEIARVEEATTEDAFPMQGEPANRETYQARMRRYEAICETVVALLAVGCFWGEQEHRALWVSAIDRLANRWPESGGLVSWLNLRQYPAVLTFYAAGIAAVAAGRLETLAALIGRVDVRRRGETEKFAVALWEVVDDDYLQPEAAPRHYTPGSDRLHDLLRESFRELLPHDERYTETFDMFEYLLGLAVADASERTGWGFKPYGSFAWRYKRHREGAPREKVEAAAFAAGADWSFLSDGLFEGSPERFAEVKKAYDEAVAKSPATW